MINIEARGGELVAILASSREYNLDVQIDKELFQTATELIGITAEIFVCFSSTFTFKSISKTSG